MKKLLVAFSMLAMLTLAACNNETIEDPASDDRTTLKVASLIPPMTEIL